MPSGLRDLLKKAFGRKKKKKKIYKRKIPRGLSIKSPGGQSYKRIAERELKKQSESARRKAGKR